jgi:hypothetical protein
MDTNSVVKQFVVEEDALVLRLGDLSLRLTKAAGKAWRLQKRVRGEGF